MGKRILIIDRNERLRTILASELQSEGYETVAVAGPQESFEQLAAAKFDLVIADPFSKEYGGKKDTEAAEFLKKFSEMRPHPRIIVLTGFAELGNAIECHKHGVDDFVSKPHDLIDLLTTMERVLSYDDPA